MIFFDKGFIKSILRHFILGVSFGIGFLSIGILAVTISGTVNTFTTGQVIKASDINTNFASLKTALENIPDWVKSGANASFPSGGITVNTSSQLNSATVTVNGRISSSVLGVYCGLSTATNGNTGGYAGAKALCVTACGNANAHMCTAHEMSISRQLNITIPSNTWFTTFVTADSNSVPNAYTDCIGFTVSNGASNGPNYTGVYGSYSGCNGSFSIACCL